MSTLNLVPDTINKQKKNGARLAKKHSSFAALFFQYCCHGLKSDRSAFFNSFCLCVDICFCVSRCWQKLEGDGVRSPGAGVTAAYELHYMGARIITLVFWESNACSHNPWNPSSASGSEFEMVICRCSWACHTVAFNPLDYWALTLIGLVQ